MSSATWQEGWGVATSGKLKDRQAVWLCFSSWCADCHTTKAIPLCVCFALPSSLGSASAILPTSAGRLIKYICSSQLKGVPGTTNSSSLWAEARLELPGASVAVSAFLRFHLSTYPTRYFSMYEISQLCLSIEQGFLRWVIAVQIVETLRGETKGISHAAIPLTSCLRTLHEFQTSKGLK